jgi:hypothetical protein
MGGFNFGDILGELDPRGNGIVGSITHDDTFKSIIGGVAGLGTSILKGLTGIFNGIGGMFDGTFIYIIMGGAVLIAGVYAYSQSKST